jgi:hypothetical protein
MINIMPRIFVICLGRCYKFWLHMKNMPDMYDMLDMYIVPVGTYIFC